MTSLGPLLPAEFAAGDFYDYVFMSDGTLGIVVGDVCGMVSSACSAYGVNQRPPAVVRVRPFGHRGDTRAREHSLVSRDGRRAVSSRCCSSKSNRHLTG